ncbi:MAG: preprotein translocase subunit SecG [Flavobacteriaceae bacterium]|nr:preprotein translocase subunit SecG [Flavobacteriaceae bacterium]
MSYTIFLILITIVAIALILIIMVQNPKGGGLSSSFGGSGTQNLGGVQSTTDFLDRATWTLAIALFALILLSNFAISRPGSEMDSQLKNTLDQQSTQQAPAADDQPLQILDSTSK